LCFFKRKPEGKRKKYKGVVRKKIPRWKEEMGVVVEKMFGCLNKKREKGPMGGPPSRGGGRGS